MKSRSFLSRFSTANIDCLSCFHYVVFRFLQSVSFTDTLFSFPISNFKFQRIQWKRSHLINVEREQYPSVLFFCFLDGAKSQNGSFDRLLY